MKKPILFLTAIIGLMMAVPAYGEQEVYLAEFGRSFIFYGEKVREGERDILISDIPSMKLPFSLEQRNVCVHHTLAEGTEAKTAAFLADSGIEGPTVYLVAGTHGDEIAGWYLADHLAKMNLRRGKLYIVPRANAPGCAKENRYVSASLDLNRAYPGKQDGDLAQRLAHAIYADIQAVKPALVLDLHEAAYYSAQKEFLGNKLIFTGLDGMEELFFELLSAYENKTLGRCPFNFVSPGVSGSLNQAVSQGLGIPVITVETFRGFPLSFRVKDQADIVHFCLKQFGMID